MRINSWVLTVLMVVIMAGWVFMSMAYKLSRDTAGQSAAVLSIDAEPVSFDRWLEPTAVREDDNRVWGVSKPDAATDKDNAGRTTRKAKPRHKVALRHSKGRHTLCVDKTCYVFLGIDTIAGGASALFMPAETSASRKPKKSVAGQDHAYRSKILKYKEGDHLNGVLVVDTVSLHRLVLHSLEDNRSFEIRQFEADIEKYRKKTDKNAKLKGSDQ
jgi:hypothetical protein